MREYDESLVPKYERLYSDQKVLGKHYASSHELVKKYCRKYGLENHIKRPMNFYPKEIQTNKKLAEYFYLKSREIMMTEGMGFKQFAFLRAAWTLDSLTEDVREIFEKSGTKGLLKLKGIGKKMADKIIDLLEARASGSQCTL